MLGFYLGCSFSDSFHVTSRHEFFTSYTSGDFDYVRIENNAMAKIIGMRKIGN